MVELFPPPQDESSGTPGTPNPRPRHDPATFISRGYENHGGANRSIADRLDSALSSVSRWAGPFIFVVTIAVLGWLIVG